MSPAAAAVHSSSPPLSRMNSSWLASGTRSPMACTDTDPAELVRTNAQSGATRTISSTRNSTSKVIVRNMDP